MKATDLMIGDKVMVKVLSQIPNTYVLHTWTANDYSRDIQVKPIPITPEILEKNGWQSFVPTAYTCCQNHLSIKNEGDIHIEWNWDEGTLSVWVSYSEDEEGINPNLIAPVRYVHELQHALRLVGFNELADNFKI